MIRNAMTLPTDPAPTRRRWPRFRSRRSRVVLGALLLLGVFIVAFDGTWLRPLIQHHIHERSGRRVDFDALHIGLNRALQPTVSLRNLVVQNASWAAPRPLVRAAVFDFTLSWDSLRGDQVEVTHLSVVDAEFDLERQADGLRNWRLTRPDDRGPGRVRVMVLDARDSRARVVDQGVGLELELQTTPLATPVTLAAHADLPLTKQIALRGNRDGTSFDAQVSVSDVLTLVGTGQPFSLRGELRAGSARAKVEGTLTDLLQFAGADVDLQIAGPRLAGLGRVLGLRAPVPAGAAEASARVFKEGARWKVSKLQAKLGRSDLAGELQFDLGKPGEGRSMLHAVLTSDRLDIADLRAPASAAPKPGADAPGGPTLDADIYLKIAAIDGLPIGSIAQASAHAALRAGSWSVDPAAFTIAGGRASGTLVAETGSAPTAYALDLRLQGLQIDKLARAAPRLEPLTGRLDARIAMRTRGDSFASLGSAASGTVQAELLRATIPDSLDAKLGLDGGRLLRRVFGTGGERTPITCSALDLRFDAGRGRARRLAFETEHVALNGVGWIDLGRGSLDLVLTPRRKQSALIALDRALQVRGELKAPRVTLIAPDAAHAGEPCVSGSMQ